MNADDGHQRNIIIKLKEKQFPEVFDFKNKKIDISFLNDPEYIKKAVGDVNYSEILALPTGLLNSSVLKNLKIDADCEKINKTVMEAFSSVYRDKKIAAVIGVSKAEVDPFGEMSFAELISVYDRHVEVSEGFADLFILDKIKSMIDLRAALLSCKKTNKPVLVNVVADLFENTENCAASSLGGLVTAQDMGACGFGFCCDNDENPSEIAAELLKYAKIPLVADLTGKTFEDGKLPCGINTVICKSGEAPRFVTNNSGDQNSAEHKDDFFIFTHYGNVFFLEADTTEISPPIQCQPNMEEIIYDSCKSEYDILRVEINSIDDAVDFARDSHMSNLPVMFFSEDVNALDMALMLYQGIALIDSSTLIPENELEKLCKKYGAVVY